MSFQSSCLPSVAGVWAAVILTALMLVSCDPKYVDSKYVGRPCDLGIPDDGGFPPSTTVTGQVLVCASRICLLPARGASVADPGTGPCCTNVCVNDDDCNVDPADLRGDASGDRRCKKGFACGVATALGELCCKKLCICLDFVDTSANGGHLPTPASCLPDSGSSCPNVR